MHAEVCPEDDENLPAAHSVHAEELATVLYCPTGHRNPVADVDPGGQYDPGAATQGDRQAAKDDAAAAALYLPAGHGVQAAEPGAAEYSPARQVEHPVALGALKYPAAHTPLQAAVVDPRDVPYCPAAHATHWVAPEVLE